jgi:MFS family permease
LRRKILEVCSSLHLLQRRRADFAVALNRYPAVKHAAIAAAVVQRLWGPKSVEPIAFESRTSAVCDWGEPCAGTRRGTVVVALCTSINMVDGFDILAISFTAPAIGSEWTLSVRELGLLFSAGLAGMTLGALLLSPLADSLGRKKTVLYALAALTVGMCLSGFATGIRSLLLCRLMTGAAVGALLPTINTIAAEAGARNRDLAVSIQGAGFPLGGFLGGLAALAGLSAGWRTIYFVGACLSLLLLAAVALGLRSEPRIRSGLRSASFHWRGRTDPLSLLMCACFFLLMFTFYFLTSWTPTLLTRLGLSASAGISGAILMNMGGVTGDIIFTLLVMRWRAGPVGAVLMMLCFAAVLLFALAPLSLVVLGPLSFVIGFLLFASILSLYASAPWVYPVELRAGGTGFALGIGRIGATVGPYVGGVLIATGWSRGSFLPIMSVPLVATAVLLGLLSSSSKSPRRVP